MTTPLKQALDALILAKESGGENDFDYYASVHRLLEQAIKKVRAYDCRLNEAERAPTGDDYNHILRLLGLDVDPDSAEPSLHGMEVQHHFKLSDSEVTQIAEKLSVPADARFEIVPISAVVVDISEGFIGGDDLSVVRATLDLRTGKVLLADNSLGYPLLSLDGLCTIIDGAGKHHGVPMIEHGIPHALDKGDIIDYVKQHGDWAILDLKSLLRDIPW
jgi:hypothetical protein